ncbi:MAG: DUF6448 family protein [Desulfatirhabdiaceae bacterium]|nr:DUF6448 family protein [Desulfatirhabdiaceae bacterium]
MEKIGRNILTVAAIALISIIYLSGLSYAHCDTLDGPVVMTAKKAIEKGDVTPVLKWVKKEHEAEIRELFKKTIAVRTKGAEAKELADTYFFETLVRIHRAGEGAPYTGLKPSGNLDFGISQADKSLETGSADELIKAITNQAAEGIRKRFVLAMEKKKHADESIEGGREFVEAYVEFLHYVERLDLDIKGPSEGHGHGDAHKEEHKETEMKVKQHKHP